MTNENVLDMYKLFVEMTDRTTQRRQSTNHCFLGINVAMIFLLTLPHLQLLWGVAVGISIIGILNCWVWRCLLKSYKTLISAKFKVICEMEEDIGYKLYDNEWKILSYGKGKKVHKEFTVTESHIPSVFCLAYVGIILLSSISAL